MQTVFLHFLKMRVTFVTIVTITVACLVILTAGARVAAAQGHRDSSQQPMGLPEDWSHRHMVFSDPGTEDEAFRNGKHDEWLKVHDDPRFMMHELKRYKAEHGGWLRDEDRRREHWNEDGQTPQSAMHRDWSINMGSGTTVDADSYPAKYSFTVSTPTLAVNCAGGTAPDFVVYNTGLAGSTTQASIIAYDNLYASPCTGNVPQVYWAYNTGGTITTSVVLSLDGKQVAFMHNNNGSGASLVLLKWAAASGTTFTGTTTNGSKSVTVSSCTGLTAGTAIYGANIQNGTVVNGCTSPTLTISLAATSGGSQQLTRSNSGAGAPIAPQSVTLANYRNCTAPCMTIIPFANGYGDTISSPYYDYGSDSIYVGDDGGANGFFGAHLGNGYLHKFTGVFNGTPAESTAASTPPTSWPVAVGEWPITSPVYDSNSGYVYSTNYTTTLTEVTSAGAVTISGPLNCPGGGNNGNDIAETPIVDGSNGKVYLFAQGNNNNCVMQLPTKFASNAGATTFTEFGTASGGIAPLYAGDFDNAYYNSGGTGNLYVCGNNGGNATLYQIPITGGTMSTTANAGPVLTSTNRQCSPATEVYNTTAGTSPYDWIFVSVQGSGVPSGCAGSGCVISVPVTSWLASTSYAKGQMIVDTHFNIEVVTTLGTSNTAQPSWPAAGSAGTVTNDGSVKWTSEGPFTFTAFQTGHAYAKNTVILDSKGNLELVTAAGTSGGSTPSWSTVFGNTTQSNTAIFTNQGPLGINSDNYAGGTSGIIIDNLSTTNGDSNVYFSTLSNETCTTSGSTGGCAVQTSQSAP